MAHWSEVEMKPAWTEHDRVNGYVITIEADTQADKYGVEGIRHNACIPRTDCFYALSARPACICDLSEHAYECWGCDGWLHMSPLTLEETTKLHKTRAEEE